MPLVCRAGILPECRIPRMSHHSIVRTFRSAGEIRGGHGRERYAHEAPRAPEPRYALMAGIRFPGRSPFVRLRVYTGWVKNRRFTGLDEYTGGLPEFHEQGQH